jgi:hypothetical protein
VIYVDSSYLQADPQDWNRAIAATVATAGRLLTRQLGYSLRAEPPRVLTAPIDQGRGLRDVFERMRRQLPIAGDTLVVVLYNQPLDVGPGGAARGRLELGRAQVGKRLVLLEGLPNPGESDRLWLPFDNALNLIHELGHALGAVHVEDPHSVMYPSSHWLAASEFDSFNRRMVMSALAGELKFDDPADYVAMFTRFLSESSYGLTDYPEVLATYLQQAIRRQGQQAEKIRAAILTPSMEQAAEGYRLLARGRRSLAAEQFRKAAQVDTHQASLYYYLSRAVDGDLGRKLRSRAAAMGFQRAVDCWPLRP